MADYAPHYGQGAPRFAVNLNATSSAWLSHTAFEADGAIPERDGRKADISRRLRTIRYPRRIISSNRPAFAVALARLRAGN